LVYKQHNLQKDIMLFDFSTARISRRASQEQEEVEKIVVSQVAAMEDSEFAGDINHLQRKKSNRYTEENIEHMKGLGCRWLGYRCAAPLKTIVMGASFRVEDTKIASRDHWKKTFGLVVAGLCCGGLHNANSVQVQTTG